MNNWKKWLSGISIITIFTLFITFGEGLKIAKDFYKDYILSDHISEIQMFSSSSSIIDHRFDEEGLLYLKYKTCNPPIETPDYYYTIWIDGKVVFNSQSIAPHFSINSWFKPLFCTEGWWGNKGFEGAINGSEVVINWHWLIDDGSYQETIMRYIVQ